MKTKFRLTSLLLALLMLFAAVPAQGDGLKIAPLTEGVPFMDALTIICAIAQTAEAPVDYDSMSYDEETLRCTVKAGSVFTLHVQPDSNANACSVGVSAAYLDGAYARQMGVIFGALIANLGDEGCKDALSGLDMNAFNALKPSQQTVIAGDFKIIMAVDPDSDTPYSLTLALKTPVLPAAPEAPSTEEARLILGRMNIDVSAAFLYDETTDLNGRLGQEGSYYSKINFARTALAPGAAVSADLSVTQGGSIEVFASHQLAVERSNYITSKMKLTGTKEHHFAYGNALLRLSGDTSPEDVGRIITAFILAVDGEFSPAAETSQETAASAVRKGDVVTFGRYEQDNNTANGKEPIQWLVADVQNGEALLVSVYALDVYNTYWGAPTWAESTLRSWTNGAFFNAAFSAEEQGTILFSTVTADNHPYYDSDPGATTLDKVFCLSYVEADSLLTNAQRQCEPTAYARKTGKVYIEGKYCYWWLRTPGRPGCGASIVCTDGSYDYDISYDGFCYGARPCIRVPANSPLLKK